MYPVMLDLTGKKILIVGGGRIAARKAKGLMGEGAVITVIAPYIDPVILELPVTIKQEVFQEQSLDAYDMVFIAADDPQVNAQVHALVTDQLVNDCTAKSNSNFFNVASFKTEGARIMISTDGRDPAYSKALKNKLKLFIEQY